MPQGIKSVRDAAVAGKRVLVRADFDVPLDFAQGKPHVMGDMRIRAVLPTVNLLRERGARVILLAHQHRPGGKVVPEYTMAPIAKRLSELLGTNISVGDTAASITVLENLRFDPGEERNDTAFAQKLASLGDIYVNDSFADSHRTHASIVGVPVLLPSYLGLHMEEELARLEEALSPPEGAVAIIGGTKFETKAPLIEKLLPLYDEILLGGAIGNDVIKARGLPVGVSLVSATPVPPMVAMDGKLSVATDAVFKEQEANAERTSLVVDVRAHEAIIDIGPTTAEAWGEKVAQAPFVLWNGPMGIYEEGYTDGTDVIAGRLVESGVRAIVGGGDTVAAVAKFAFDPKRVWLSTGGGAMLQFLTTGTLPGIDALRQK